MPRASLLASLVLVSLSAAACGGGTTAADAGTDAGSAHDSGATDAGATDAGATDAGSAHDSGATDAGATDAGATDAGATDAGATDAGATDAGAMDDAGNADAGNTDAGPMSCPSGMHVCICATGYYCLFFGGACLAPTAPCPPPTP